MRAPTKFYNLSRSLSTSFPASIAVLTIVSGFYHTPDEPIIIFEISSLLSAKVEGYEVSNSQFLFFK